MPFLGVSDLTPPLCLMKVLVGESLIKQEDPGKAIAGLFGKDISHAGAT
jgi:hypothetical protein